MIRVHMPLEARFEQEPMRAEDSIAGREDPAP